MTILKLIFPTTIVGATLLLTSGCATTGAIQSIAKSEVKKAAAKAAVGAAADQAGKALGTDAETSTNGVKTTGGVVKQSRTEVIAPTAKKEKSGMLKMRKTLPAMKKTYGKASRLAGVKDYVVPFYRINYLIDSNYTNESNNSYTAAKARVLSKLEGVSPATFDELTELAYADFKQKMADAGFIIKPHGNLKTVQKYIAKGEGKYPGMGKHAYFGVPKGVTSTSGKNSTAALMVEMKDKVNVLDVNLDANFVINNRNEKKFNIKQAKETVYTSQGANIYGGVKIRIPNTEVRFEIGQPPYSQIAFGTMEDVTKGGDKAGDMAVMATGLLFGKGQLKRSTTKRKLVKADEARYKEAMVDALKQANTMIVNTLAENK